MPLTPAPLFGLALFLGYHALLRLAELWISARHLRVLRQRGAVERGAGQFPWFVVLHTLFPLALGAEVIWGGARPDGFWWLWLVLLGSALTLRIAVIKALGVHWNVRVVVVPGTSPIRRGVYRWVRHPNYIAVVVEFLAAPMLFGAWRTALVFSLLNAVILSVRIRTEEQALDWAARAHR
jgi:methyltransferase